MPNYQSRELLSAAELDEKSATLFADGSEAGATSGDYVLAAVFLAAVLLFVGISSRLDGLPALLSMIAMGAGTLFFVAWQLAGYPIT